ncbi:NAD(P)-binding protein [Lophium mytilinum]|uniref:NAD(P)-binding protein n=1 Tax=Lophium mytilinum TaxID=390894 RepID=A0A6A6R5F9_9PEZI|nr:NAD(P)-binding protein [Lophium mytilinum]
MAGTSKVKLAVIGTGLIGPRHAEAVLTDPDAELSCIVDPSPAAGAVAERLKCPIYSSIQAMLASSSKPDAALVCTPNHTHVAVSKELLDGGLHVLCEKPISVDLQSGKELVDYAASRNLHLLIGHHRRFNRYVITTKQLVPSLGRIIALNGLWTSYKPPEYFDPPTEWRRLESAGPILINLIHEIDILNHLFGPITRVHAEATPKQREHAVEEGAAIILKFASGAVGTFVLSDAIPSPYSFEAGTGENPTIPYTGQDFYRIFGTNASLSVPDMHLWSYPSGQKSWTETIDSKKVEVEEMKAPFELQVAHFVKVIRGQEEPSCSGKDGLRAVVVCEAIKKALKQGGSVDIAEDL